VRAPVVRRHFAATCAFLLGAGLSTIGALLYRGRHAWYGQHGRAGALLALGLLASALLAAALLGWLRARSQRTLLSTWCPTLGAIALIAGAFVVHARAQPSGAEARRALAEGDLARAERVVDALRTQALAPSVLDVLRDDIVLARMERAARLEDKLALAAHAPRFTSTREPRMHRQLVAALTPRATEARRANDAPSLERLASAVAAHLPTEAHALRVDAATIAARACLQRDDVACAERAASTLSQLDASEPRLRIEARLVTIYRERLDEALTQVTRARTDAVLRAQLTAALGLCEKLEALHAPVPPPTCVVVARQLARLAPEAEPPAVADRAG